MSNSLDMRARYRAYASVCRVAACRLSAALCPPGGYKAYCQRCTRSATVGHGTTRPGHPIVRNLIRSLELSYHITVEDPGWRRVDLAGPRPGVQTACDVFVGNRYRTHGMANCHEPACPYRRWWMWLPTPPPFELSRLVNARVERIDQRCYTYTPLDPSLPITIDGVCLRFIVLQRGHWRSSTSRARLHVVFDYYAQLHLPVWQRQALRRLQRDRESLFSLLPVAIVKEISSYLTLDTVL